MRRISIIVGIVVAVLLAPTATHTSQLASTITTEVGERNTIQLATGTELELNTSSRVHVDPDPSLRSVVLERGEIILNVADDKHGPWRLQCDDLEVQMTSAKVHVRYEATDSASRIDVIAGSASIKRATESWVVQAGEFVTIRPSLSAPSRFDPGEVERKTAWTRGMLIFQGDPLKYAVAEFNRYNHRQLVIGDESIANLVPGGTFNVTDVDEFANSLRMVFGVRVLHRRSGNAGPETIVLVGPHFRDI